MLACCWLLSAGCNYPAQLVWSPDGSRAAYRVGERGYLVARDGSVLRDFGESAVGGFAWSADGRRLNYAAARADGEGDAEPSPVRREFFEGPAPPFEWEPPDKLASVRVLVDGRAERELCRLRGNVVHATLSPDESWLAVLATVTAQNADGVARGGAAHKGDADEGGAEDAPAEKDETGWLDLYAISVRTGEAYLLSHPAWVGMAFTGPNRLAYVERDRVPTPKWKALALSNRVVEVTLRAGEPRAPRSRPFETAEVTVWLRAG